MSQDPDPAIQQMIPAPDWYAVFQDSEPPYYSTFPLVCWALVQDAPGGLRHPYIAGYYADPELGVRCAEDQYWIAYATEAQLTDAQLQRQWTTAGRAAAIREGWIDAAS